MVSDWEAGWGVGGELIENPESKTIGTEQHIKEQNEKHIKQKRERNINTKKTDIGT